MHGDLRTLCYSISCPDRVILEGLRLREWLEPAVDLWSWHLCGGCYELFGHLHKDGDLYQQGFHTQTFVERSRFLRTEAGRWLYGERPAPGAAASSLVTSIGACGMWAMRLPMPAQRLPVHTSRA